MSFLNDYPDGFIPTKISIKINKDEWPQDFNDEIMKSVVDGSLYLLDMNTRNEEKVCIIICEWNGNPFVECHLKRVDIKRSLRKSLAYFEKTEQYQWCSYCKDLFTEIASREQFNDEDDLISSYG